MWQQRERELARMSAELQDFFQRQSLTHQQDQLNRGEVIYQQLLRIDQQRTRAQGATELWLQNIAQWMEREAARIASMATSSSPSLQRAEHGGIVQSPFLEVGAVMRSLLRAVIRATVLLPRSRASFTAESTWSLRRARWSLRGDNGNKDLLREIRDILRAMQKNGLAKMIFNYRGNDFRRQMGYAEALLDETYK